MNDSAPCSLERVIHQVWIGPVPPPTRWLNTWKEKNPNWQYVLWDNKKVFSRKWKNQHIIDEYVRMYNEEIKGRAMNGQDMFVSSRGAVFFGEKATLFAWHVIADVLRYEILYEYGGYMPGADTVCLKSIDDKFTEDFDAYTVRTGNLYVRRMKQLERRYRHRPPVGRDKLMFDRYAYENASPILACKKGSKFVGQLIEELHKLKLEDLGEAVDTTGNVFMGKMIRKYQPEGLKMIDYVPNAQRVNVGQHSVHYAGTMKDRYREGR